MKLDDTGLGGGVTDRLNNNMRCFEITECNISTAYVEVLNNNMRCFEIRLFLEAQFVHQALNNNMRCFEIKLAFWIDQGLKC